MQKRSDNEMWTLIQQVAQNLGVVQAIALNGSRANPQVVPDQFQDFDIVYFVPDGQMLPLLTDRSWLQQFGPQIVMQAPGDFDEQPDYQHKYNLMILFTDGNRLDLGLCPLSGISDWAANDPVAKILSDPHHLLPQNLEHSDQIYWTSAPTAKEFRNCCNEFWWVTPYVVKGLQRHELFYATDHAYQNCFHELRCLLDWRVAATAGFHLNLGKSDKYLWARLAPTLQKQIQVCLDLSSEHALARGLVQMNATFDQQAQLFAEEQGFTYHLAEATAVRQYVRQELATLLK